MRLKCYSHKDFKTTFIKTFRRMHRIYMFQEWFVQLVSTISDIVVALSAIAVFGLGLAGLQQWKRELRGKSQFEIARRIALYAFDFKERFHGARSSFTFVGQSAERAKAENETREVTEVMNEWYARSKHMEELNKTARLLHEATWEGSVLLDPRITELVKPLEKSLSELFVSFYVYFQAQLRNAKQPNRTAGNEDWLEEHFHRVYGTPNDSIAKHVDAAVDALVQKVKCYIR